MKINWKDAKIMIATGIKMKNIVLIRWIVSCLKIRSIVSTHPVITTVPNAYRNIVSITTTRILVKRGDVYIEIQNAIRMDVSIRG